MSGLLTTLIVSLLWCVKVDTLGTLCKKDLDRAYHPCNNFILIIVLSFYILFLIPSFLIHPHKLFSMQLGPGTASLACARLIVPFAPFSAMRLIVTVNTYMK